MTADKKSITALIIDDDQMVADMLGQILQDAGLNTIITFDGKSAIKLYLDKKPDIIFSDFLMPEINGVMVLKAIKALNAKIPIVLFTGYYNQLMDELKGEIVKPDRILRKPFIQVEKIHDLIREFFPGYEIDA
ncbi:MAG: response regulator [candidate division Zixibacteria bacterium]|nr:response regulator [Candidatus Tariuqbacter arcticus]